VPVTTSLAAVQHALSNYLKMAPYRQRDAGKDATLDADSDVELDCVMTSHQPDLLTVWVPNHQGKLENATEFDLPGKSGKLKNWLENQGKVWNYSSLGRKCACTNK